MMMFFDMFGSGGGPSIPQRDSMQEWGTIKDLEKGQQNQYNQFVKKDPILGGLYTQATDYMGSDISPILQNLLKYGASITANPGALTQEEQLATKRTADEFAQAHGTFFNPSTVATEALTSDIYSRQKAAEQIAQATGIEQLSNQDTAQRFQLPEGVVNTATGAFTGLTNPVLQYASDLFGSNQSAAADEAIAGANKSAGGTGAALQTVGQVAGMAAMFASDKRLKEKIKPTGKKTPEGIPIKDFNYRGDKRRFRGVIAQDVEKVRPDAVVTLPLTGHKLVDSSKFKSPLLQEIGG